MAHILKLSNGRKLGYSIFGVPNPGPGKTVIYHHGFMSGRMEAEILGPRAHSIGVRVITIDRAGYGDSTHDPYRTPESFTRDIEELLDALLQHDEKVVFYGVSGKQDIAVGSFTVLTLDFFL